MSHTRHHRPRRHARRALTLTRRTAGLCDNCGGFSTVITSHGPVSCPACRTT